MARATTGVKWLAAGVGVAAAVYAAYVGTTWYRYGNVTLPGPEEQDPLLDRFMPAYEIVERHHVRVAAPAATTLDAARAVDVQGSPIARTIIRAREVILGATESVFRTETRAIATDANARARFRRYWSFLSPGIIAIRWVLLGPVKREAERRVFPRPFAT